MDHAIGLGESLVQEQPRGGHVRVDRLEHDAICLILVEPAVDEIAQIAAALRGAVRKRAIDRGAAAGSQRIGGTGFVHGVMAKKRDEVARRRKADPGHQRVGRLVDELVDRADWKGGSGRGEADGLRIDELPTLARDDGGLLAVAVAHQQRGRSGRWPPPERQRAAVVVALLNRNSSHTVCSIGPEPPVAVGTSMRKALLAAGRPGIQPLQTTEKPWRIRKPLPASSGVAGSLLARRAVELDERALVAAVVDVVEQGAVALGQVGGLENVEVGRVLDFSARIARRLVEIDDHGVERKRGIELAVEAADDLLVGADARRTAGRRRTAPVAKCRSG